MNSPRVNHSHIVPACYLRNFSDASGVALRLVHDPARAITVSVRSAGVRNAFYRRTRPNGESIDDTEHSMSVLESASAPIIQNFLDNWPLGEKSKATVAEFISLQILRSPAWHAWHEEFTQNELHALRANGVPQMAGLPRKNHERVISKFSAAMDTDTERMVRMLALLAKVGSVIGSMRWSVIHFARPLLATSDHPVCVWPSSEWTRTPQRTDSGQGFTRSAELRFPISPHLALVMDWIDDEDPPEKIRGARHHAQNMNAFTIAQAERQWFHLPGQIPPHVTGRFIPLSSEFARGYSAATVDKSERRIKAAESVNRRLGTGLEDREIEIITVKRHR